MRDAFYKGLVSIINEYCEDDFEKYGFEPLDGDEVDTLTEHIRNKLNLMNGNITDLEYDELESSLRTNRLTIEIV